MQRTQALLYSPPKLRSKQEPAVAPSGFYKAGKGPQVCTSVSVLTKVVVKNLRQHSCSAHRCCCTRPQSCAPGVRSQLRLRFLQGWQGPSGVVLALSLSNVDIRL